MSELRDECYKCLNNQNCISGADYGSFYCMTRRKFKMPEHEDDSIYATKFAAMQKQIDDKDKRIKELERENESKEKAYNDCYCEYKHYKQFDSISTQKVKDILNEIQEEYNKLEEQFDCIWDKKSKDNYDRYKLQELSAMQQELGFILGKFEKLLGEENR